MKKIIISSLFLLSSFALYSQTVKQDSKGNYYQVKTDSIKTTAKPTGKTFTDSKGTVYPVMVSKNGKLFIVRTSKKGNRYNQYLSL